MAVSSDTFLDRDVETETEDVLGASDSLSSILSSTLRVFTRVLRLRFVEVSELKLSSSPSATECKWRVILFVDRPFKGMDPSLILQICV